MTSQDNESASVVAALVSGGEVQPSLELHVPVHGRIRVIVGDITLVPPASGVFIDLEISNDTHVWTVADRWGPVSSAPSSFEANDIAAKLFRLSSSISNSSGVAILSMSVDAEQVPTTEEVRNPEPLLDPSPLTLTQGQRGIFGEQPAPPLVEVQ